jgi:peroxiredoxin
MKTWWIHVLAAGAIALPLAAQEGKKDDKPPVEAPKSEPLKVGSTVAETVTLKDVDGKVSTFKDLRGKVVILHWWSDRCPAEKHAEPVVKALEQHFKDKDVVILAVCSNTKTEMGDEPAKDADYSKEYMNFRDKAKAAGFAHRIVVDHSNKLSNLFGAQSTPHCFVVDQKGKLAYAGALDDDPKGEKGEAAKVYIRDAADALLAGKEVAVKETKPYG